MPRFTIRHDSQRFFSAVTTFIVRAARASGEKKEVIGVAIVCCSSIGARVVVRRQRPRPNIVRPRGWRPPFVWSAERASDDNAESSQAKFSFRHRVHTHKQRFEGKTAVTALSNLMFRHRGGPRMTHIGHTRNTPTMERVDRMNWTGRSCRPRAAPRAARAFR